MAAGDIKWHPVRNGPDTGHPGRSGQRGVKIQDFECLYPLPFRQWMPPRKGAWAFLEEENLSSPRSGRLRRSNVFLRNGSDLGVLSTCLLDDNFWGQRPSFERSSTSRGWKYSGKVSLERGDNGFRISKLAPTRKRARGRALWSKVPWVVRIEGSGHFGQAAFHREWLHWREHRLSFEGRISALQGGVGRHALVAGQVMGAI